jgi:hypothetical protein
VLRSLNPCRSPGEDGVPYEWYKALWPIMGSLLVKTWNQSRDTVGGMLPASSRSALIHLIKRSQDERGSHSQQSVGPTRPPRTPRSESARTTSGSDTSSGERAGPNGRKAVLPAPGVASHNQCERRAGHPQRQGGGRSAAEPGQYGRPRRFAMGKNFVDTSQMAGYRCGGSGNSQLAFCLL